VPKNPSAYSRGQFVTTKANEPVGRPASANKGIAMFKLTIELKLSYKQLQFALLLLMLFLG
jgi:hypothetical protein